MNKFKSNNEGRCPIYSVQLIERAIEEEFPIHTKQVGQTGNKNLEDKEISSALFKTSKPVDNGDPAIVKVSRQLHEADKHFKEKDKGDKIVCKKLKKNTASSRGREETDTEIHLTYIGMIAQAISSSREKRLVLADIYRYMQRSFFHYLCNKPRWKNTVRHNLSYHNCFVKRESSKGTKRSHYWIIHPDYVEQFNRENYNKELDDVPTSSISETNRRPSPGQQVSFTNYGHLQPHASVATSDFSRPPPRELTFAEYERAIQAPPIPNGECLIPFMPPRSHAECYMQQFAMPAYSHQGPLNFHPGLDQDRQYPYQQFVPVHGEFNSLKTPTTSMGHTQEFSENYPR